MADVTQDRFEIEGFGGRLIHPRDAQYDEARAMFNGMYDRVPALIARCATTDDVVAAVRLAVDRGLELSVYSGGHSVTGSAVVDDGVCVDLRGMRAIAVDPQAKTARVEGGATWGEIDAVTQQHGLAVTGGRISSTGVGGLTLGSGSGWLERKFGYTCDNLLRAELVTADGQVVAASADENPDLFWALRGGGGNFGIVTAFHFRLHEVGPTVLAGMVLYPGSAAREVVRFYRDFAAAAPDELGSALAFITAPPAEFVPSDLHGQPVVGVLACCAGPLDEAEAAVAPLREFRPIVADLIAPMPYVDVQQLSDAANPAGALHYWSSDILSGLPDDAIDVLIEQSAPSITPMSQVILIPGGGAIARIDDNATAFGERQAPLSLHYVTIWTDPAESDAAIEGTRRIAAAMRPWITGRAYLNFIGAEGTNRIEAAFGPEKYRRLTELKRIWDPTNLFRHNQNIPPA